MAKASVESNIESLGDLIGTVQGISDAMSDQEYIDSLIEDAHYSASKAFDTATAATAHAGYLTHVYEYGVAGITGGTAKITDATSPEARLYVHSLIGNRGSYDIGFYFRPALVPNPQPTTASTGVASVYLRKLSRRKYIFRSRAIVMEDGEEVQIKPKNGNLLFVPFYGQPSRNPLNKKGFMMYPYAPNNEPITITPGRSTKGSFGAHWMKWWGDTGQTMMGAEIQSKIPLDIMESMQAMEAVAAGEALKPIESVNTISSALSTNSATREKYHRKSKSRRRRRK